MLRATVVASLAAAATAQPGDASDFLIVGGGTAGCVLAKRLCEGLPDASVTLLERGAPRTPEQELKVRALRLAFDTWDDPGITEKWDSTENPGLLGKKVDVLAGATLGGTSSMNVAQWTRPVPSEPAGWGLEGLSAEESTRLYEKAEGVLKPVQPNQDLWQTYVEDYLRANARAGVNVIEGPDPASRDQIWINHLLGDPNTGERVDSCSAYLTGLLGPGGACPNLNLVQGYTATKVLFDSAGDRATGVEAQEGPGAPPRVFEANNEVIITAGPFGSPKLLQLSGIGVPEVLRSAGIDVRTALPVGADAQGRPTTVVANTYAFRSLAPEATPRLYRSEEAEAQFEAGQGGLLGVSCFITDGVLAPPVDALTFSTVTAPPQVGALTDYLKLHLSLCLLNPDGRSTVFIKSADPFESPEVDLDFLGNDADANRAAACLTRQREVIRRMPWYYGMKEVLPALLGLNRIFTPTRSQARLSTQNAYHYVSGCKINEVVGPTLKVKSSAAGSATYRNLRVCDSSIIPNIPNNVAPMSSVFMVAEYLSEKLIEEYSSGDFTEE